MIVPRTYIHTQSMVTINRGSPLMDRMVAWLIFWLIRPYEGMEVRLRERGRPDAVSVTLSYGVYMPVPEPEVVEAMS